MVQPRERLAKRKTLSQNALEGHRPPSTAYLIKRTSAPLEDGIEVGSRGRGLLLGLRLEFLDQGVQAVDMIEFAQEEKRLDPLQARCKVAEAEPGAVPRRP